MITSKQLQNAYIRLYPALREYLWPFNQVVNIADLEVSIFDRFPDMDKVKLNFNRVKSNCESQKLPDEDENLRKQLIKMSQLLNEDNEVYAKLDTRIEGGNAK